MGTTEWGDEMVEELQRVRNCVRDALAESFKSQPDFEALQNILLAGLIPAVAPVVPLVRK